MGLSAQLTGGRWTGVNRRNAHFVRVDTFRCLRPVGVVALMAMRRRVCERSWETVCDLSAERLTVM